VNNRRFFVVVVLLFFLTISTIWGNLFPVKADVSTSSFDLLIVVSLEIQQSGILEGFISFKESQGFVSQMITPEEMIEGINGSDTPEKIRNYLKKNYQAMGFKYVLFIGDPFQPKERDKKTTGGSVPMRYCFPFSDKHTTSSKVEEDVYRIPTDLYYADLTGDWDSDRDGFFGEHSEDKVNLVPEIFIGRIPFDDQETIQLIIEKSIDFENRDMNTKKKILMMASNNSTKPEFPDYAVLTELMKKNLLEKKGYTSTTMYEKEGIKPSEYMSDFPLDEENAVQQITKNTRGLTLCVSNGGFMNNLSRYVWTKDKNYNDKPETDECEFLPLLSEESALDFSTENTSLFFITGYMPGAPDWNSECITKTIIQTKGAVVIGNSRSSYITTQWSSSGDGGMLSVVYNFYNTLLSGKTISESLYRAFAYSSDTDWFNAYSFGVLYGDPTVAISQSTANPDKPPTAPKNLKAKQNGSNVVLTWTSSTKQTYPIDGYAVFRGTSAGTESYLGTSLDGSLTYEDREVSIGKKYFYVVKAFDTKKKYSEPSNSVSIEIKESKQEDKTSPEITIQSPVDNAIVTDPNLTITGKVEDTESGVSVVEVNDKPVSFDRTGKFSTSLLLQEGENTIKIFARDNAGNEAEKSIIVTFQKTKPPLDDTIPPHLKFFYPRNGDVLNVDSVEVSGRVWDDESGIERAVLNDMLLKLSADGSFTATQLLESGTNKLRLEAWDKAGNKAQDEIFVIFKEEVTIELTIGVSLAKINGQDFPLDVPPLIIKGRTFIPLRFISEAFGAEVTWDAETRSVRMFFENTNSRITLQIDNPIARVNEKVVKLDAPPTIVGGRTMVPIRFIAEAFGADVFWDALTKTVTIKLKL